MSKNTKIDIKPLVFIEKRGKKWQKTIITIIKNKVKVPIMARLFGKKQVTVDKENNLTTELSSIIYKGIIYIYQEIQTEVLEIGDPRIKKEK